MFRDKLYWPDGDDLGEAAYAYYVNPGGIVLTSRGKLRGLHVLDLVPVPEESPYDGLIRVDFLSR